MDSLQQQSARPAEDRSEGPAAGEAGQPVALVTGTSSGFGLLTALALAGAGYRVIAAMRDLSRRGPLLEQAESSGIRHRLECIRLDVTDERSIAQAMMTIREKYGRVDLLVNNAGIAVGGAVEDIPMEDWRRQMETNFFGLVAVTKQVLPLMRGQRRGTIVNVGSMSGRFGIPGYAPYAASKFAVEGFSESLRHEMLPFGVHVVLVEPGAYKTAIWQKGFAGIRTAPDSPYRARLQAVLRYSERAARTAPDPREIAALIVRIAGKRYPWLRYPAGKGVRLLLFALAVVPWKWRERAIKRVLG